MVRDRPEDVGGRAVGERIGPAVGGRTAQERQAVRDLPERDGADVEPPPAVGEPSVREPERQDVEQGLADRVADRPQHRDRPDDARVGDLHPDGRPGGAGQHRGEGVGQHHPAERAARAVGVQQHPGAGGGQRVEQDGELVPGAVHAGRAEVDEHVAGPEGGDGQTEGRADRGAGELALGRRPAGVGRAGVRGRGGITVIMAPPRNGLGVWSVDSRSPGTVPVSAARRPGRMGQRSRPAHDRPPPGAAICACHGKSPLHRW